METLVSAWRQLGNAGSSLETARKRWSLLGYSSETLVAARLQPGISLCNNSVGAGKRCLWLGYCSEMLHAAWRQLGNVDNSLVAAGKPLEFTW